MSELQYAVGEIFGNQSDGLTVGELATAASVFVAGSIPPQLREFRTFLGHFLEEFRYDLEYEAPPAAGSLVETAGHVRGK